MVKFKDFPRPLSVFQVFFKANLIFKDFLRQPCYSSTVQAFVNPDFAKAVLLYYPNAFKKNSGILSSSASV